MVGFMNDEAFRLTNETGSVHFFSRSRGKLWLKGETSGHRLLVKEFGPIAMLIACWSEPKRSALVFAMKAMRAASFVALSLEDGWWLKQRLTSRQRFTDRQREAETRHPEGQPRAGDDRIAEAFGGRVVRAPRLVHGKASLISHRRGAVLRNAGAVRSGAISFLDCRGLPHSLIRLIRVLADGRRPCCGLRSRLASISDLYR